MAIDMKTKIKSTLSMLILASLSANSFAAWNVNNPYDKSTMYGFGYQDLLSMCSSYESVGTTSVFNDMNEYTEYYPKMGQLLAEIEAMPGISSNSKSYASSQMSEAKDKKVLVFSSASGILFFKDRNSNSINQTEELYASIIATFDESMDQLQSESNYITSEVVQDVSNSLLNKNLSNK